MCAQRASACAHEKEDSLRRGTRGGIKQCNGMDVLRDSRERESGVYESLIDERDAFTRRG